MEEDTMFGAATEVSSNPFEMLDHNESQRVMDNARRKLSANQLVNHPEAYLLGPARLTGASVAGKPVLEILVAIDPEWLAFDERVL
jgi:hypothetical protein